MTLSFDQIRELTLGAVRWEERYGSLCLRRFTLEEQELYRARRQESYLRAFATAGLRPEFETESAALFLKVQVLPSTSRRWFSRSVFADGKRIGELSGELRPEDTALERGELFRLGPGKKRGTVYFPWSVESRILELSLEDGAEIRPMRKAGRLLSYGDSITQGYDAPSPEEAYIVRLADALDAELICKAIGGERFWPELPRVSDVPSPDLITVAYGTNDWSLSKKENFLRDSLGFQALRQRYPQAPVLALAPIWRGDIHTRARDLGAFTEVAAQLHRIAREIPGMTVIDCFGFVPMDPSSFAGLRLHPNGIGFRHYADNFLKALGLGAVECLIRTYRLTPN